MTPTLSDHQATDGLYMVDLNTYLEHQLHSLEEDGLLRRLVPLVQLGEGRIAVSGRSLLNLSGNDYLGLGTDRDLVGQFYDRVCPENVLENYGPTASASRLMTGNAELYDRLETKLARLYGTESALVFNSGYHGNAGILPALAAKGDLILADKLCHASLIDGMRLSRADTIRFRHLDYTHLEEILEQKRNTYNQVFIVSESIFSMDGDSSDLHILTELKQRFQCSLYLDEAHSVGVFGKNGLGMAEQEGIIRDVDLLFGTFGKALAGLGGFLTCSRTVREFLVNRARPLIFSTALPPICLNWLLFVLDQIPRMTDERNHLQRLAENLRHGLTDQGLVTAGNSQIVPVVFGDNQHTVQAADKLRRDGYWVTAVRPPTVPVGSARLRLSLSAAMKQADLDELPARIAGVMSSGK